MYELMMLIIGLVDLVSKIANALFSVEWQVYEVCLL